MSYSNDFSQGYIISGGKFFSHCILFSKLTQIIAWSPGIGMEGGYYI